MERETNDSRATPIRTPLGLVTPVARTSAVRLRSRWMDAGASYVRPVHIEVESAGSTRVYRIPDVTMVVRLALASFVVASALLRRLITW